MREREPRSFERVPDELKAYNQWVNWRLDEERKRPINPFTLGNAGVHWPNSWAPFEKVAAMAARNNLGLGFVLTENDPYTCVDLDHCVGEDGRVSDGTRAILDLLSGWVELSPSQTGLHIWVRNEEPINRRTKGIEVYSSMRWITVTGRSNPHMPKETPDRTLELQELVRRYFPAKRGEVHVAPPLAVAGDEALWEQLFTSNRGAFFQALYDGDTSVCYGDHSRAVILLANELALLTGLDAERVKHLLYQTDLVRGKWEEQRGALTWIDYQIQDAIEFVAGRQ